MLMKHDLNGLKDASGSEVEEMKKNGWYEYSYEQHAKDCAAKYAKNAEKVSESDTIKPTREAVKGKPGRKPKSSLGGVHGNRTDQG